MKSNLAPTLLLVPWVAPAWTRAQEASFEVAAGIEVEVAVPHLDSWIAMLEVPGRGLILSGESTGLWWCEGGAGRESFGLPRAMGAGEASAERWLGIQGMTLDASGALVWVGTRVDGAGDSVHALWRGDFEPDSGKLSGARALLHFNAPGEHGAHGVVSGPDGRLYVVVGDQARIVEAPIPGPLDAPPPPSILTTLPDPNGHGVESAWPFGFVATVEFDGPEVTWGLHSVGYRNPYDLAFDGQGRLHTVDSDMEWDVGLPWYRPVRVLECIEGADYGSRSGSGSLTEDHADIAPSRVELGRASPTGVAIWDGATVPVPWKGSLIVGDWTGGQLLVVESPDAGSGDSPRVARLARSKTTAPITDVVARADGSVLFCTGGRGLLGQVHRLRFDSEAVVGLPPFEGAQSPPKGAHTLRSDRRRALDESELASLGRHVSLPEDVDGRLDLLERWVETLDGSSSDEVDRLGLHLRRNLDLHLFMTEEAQRVRYMRLLELALARIPEARRAPLGRILVVGLVGSARDASPARLRSLVTLYALVGGDRQWDVLFGVLANSSDRSLLLHVAHALRIAPPMDDGRMGAWLGFLEEAMGWSGGASFGGYLRGIHGAALERVDLKRARRLAEDGVLGPRSLARILSREAAATESESTQALVDALVEALDSPEESLRGPEWTALQSDVLEELRGSTHPSLAPWLRELHDTRPELEKAALIALSGFARIEDEPLFLSGLSRTVRDVPEASADALVRLDRAPKDAATWYRAFAATRRLGSTRGFKTLRVLEAWGNQPTAPRDPALFTGILEAWEQRLARRFPDFEPPEDPTASPWDEAGILAYLDRSQGRAGSAERGARVLAQTACLSCHTLSGQGQGWGPDLTGITQRFDRRALIESLMRPSAVIADRYGTTRVETHDGRLFDGRIVSEDASSIVLSMADGSRVALDRPEIADLRPSTMSAMPEGLLEDLSLEEIKDLIAHLEANGKAEADAGVSSPWIDCFQGRQRSRWVADPKLWRQRGPSLEGTAKSLDSNRYLLSRDTYRNFEVEFDVRLDGSLANSGFQYRSTLDPGAPNANGIDPVGYQADLGGAYWGSLFATDGRNALARPPRETWFPAVNMKGWNHVYLRVEGDRHLCEINGVTMYDHRDDAFTEGLIGFQLHGGVDMGLRIRQARIRVLGE